MIYDVIHLYTLLQNNNIIESEILNGLIISGPNQSLHLGRENIVPALREAALRESPLYVENIYIFFLF